MKSYKKIKSLEIAFDVLEYLAGQAREVSASEIMLALDVPKATLMSVLETMTDRKYVETIGTQYDLGIKLASFWARRLAMLERRKEDAEREIQILNTAKTVS